MSRLVAALRLIGVGWYVGVSIILGVLGGLWLDDKFNSRPFLVIAGLVLGIIVAFYGVYRMILPNINKKRSERKK
ncbi:MAG: AtpZ/AtpI family protein [Dehalococcoidales bacterium]|nr:AtpZ/AtpI family protein [Dehalococcoidales bacterium]MDZ4230557.1 AtpZ/AtpI family protein [Dehalococcoidales bacterium]